VLAFSTFPLKLRRSGGRADSVFFYENVRRIASLGPNQTEWNYEAGACNSGVAWQVWASVKDTSRNKEYRTGMKQIRIPCIASALEEETNEPRVSKPCFRSAFCATGH